MDERLIHQLEINSNKHFMRFSAYDDGEIGKI